MQLRPRQAQFVDRCTEALLFHGNTLGVAPTGGGKTVMLSAVASDVNGWDGPICVVQHRDELLMQNRKTLHAYNKKADSDLFNADRKRWNKTGVTFAMAQTLARPDNLKTMPPLGLLIVDEAHHAPSDSYLRVIDHALKLNDKCKLLGVTATPNRGDRKAMRAVFSNCADQISIKELIETGFLVRPRTFVIDLGVTDKLKNVKRTASDFDMNEVASIMDHKVLNDRVVEEWQEHAADRRTVVFCSTIAHAEHVAATFMSYGVTAGVVHGELPDRERADILAAYEHGEIQVLVNVAVLVEGWDSQPTSCIVLLRPSSYKSTMIQMVGRGLRKVDPERYPGIRKDDCIVLDFGTSILQHGSIEQEVMLDGAGTKICKGCEAIVPKQCQECPICGLEFPAELIIADTKKCKECGADNPIAVRFCEECGAEFPKKEKEDLEEFALSEIDVLQFSPYKWENMFEGLAWVACAFEAWAMCISWRGRWIALGGKKESPLRILGDYADQSLALVSADDFLREQGDMEMAAKTARWLSLPPTDAQLRLLDLTPMTAMGMTRYRASCCLTWMFNERGVKRRLEDYQNQRQLVAA